MISGDKAILMIFVFLFIFNFILNIVITVKKIKNKFCICKNKIYQKNYLDKKKGIFFGYSKYEKESDDDLDKIIITSTFNTSVNEMVVLPAKIVKRIGKPELAISSMYSNN